MNLKHKLLICGLLIPAITLAGTRTYYRSKESGMVDVYGITDVYRHVDERYGVVCWITGSGHSGGISCLPLSQTRRPQVP